MEGLIVVGEISYTYIPSKWSQEEFLRLGGFTVVFHNYNKAAFIEKSVASALDQDFPLCEMFFMDDASTDGSGDTMERLVRAYRGRHKVTVVRNTENQHICGQWNIVSKLATGNWFGMFCADDIAYPNRVSRVAAVVRQYPTLLGLCTNGTMRNVKTGEVEGRINSSRERVFANGELDPFDVAREEFPIIGATAFWHRSLFDRPLTKAPLDDVLLRWIVQSRSTGASPTWLWAGDLETVEYSIGCGITSAVVDSERAGLTPISRWVSRTRQMRALADMKEATMREVRACLYDSYDNGRLIAAVLWKLTECRIVGGNTFSRIVILPKLIELICFRYMNSTDGLLLVKQELKYLIHEFFGLHVAAFVSTVILHRALLEYKESGPKLMAERQNRRRESKLHS